MIMDNFQSWATLGCSGLVSFRAFQVLLSAMLGNRTLSQARRWSPDKGGRRLAGLPLPHTRTPAFKSSGLELEGQARSNERWRQRCRVDSWLCLSQDLTPYVALHPVPKNFGRSFSLVGLLETSGISFEQSGAAEICHCPYPPSPLNMQPV